MTEPPSIIGPTDESSHPKEANWTEPSGGPPVYANWKALDAGRPWLVTVEYPLFTDAWITGNVSHGPYQFLNTVPKCEAGFVQPAIILRCDWHWEFPDPDMTRTDAD